jgi:hypothetical protein
MNLIGSTDSQPVVAGVKNLGSLKTVGTNQAGSDAWRVPSGWAGEFLYVALVTYQDGVKKPVDVDVTRVRLEAGGTSWIPDAPNVNFVSIAYSVNGGSIQYIDLAKADEIGIGAGPGDFLQLEVSSQ